MYTRYLQSYIYENISTSQGNVPQSAWHLQGAACLGYGSAVLHGGMLDRGKEKEIEACWRDYIYMCTTVHIGIPTGTFDLLVRSVRYLPSWYRYPSGKMTSCLSNDTRHEVHAWP